MDRIRWWFWETSFSKRQLVPSSFPSTPQRKVAGFAQGADFVEIDMSGSMLLLKWICFCVFLTIPCVTTFGQGKDNYDQRRQRLVRDVLIPSGIKEQRVIDAMLATERHRFVPESLRERAYFDMALPIGDAQTISSPLIVATMTQALKTEPTDKVLEIGTGSGYQAAVLSPLVKHVYTIEIVESLGLSAQKLLKDLGKYDNVTVKVGDGFLGWPEFAPFDKIIVTCSPEDVPQPLVDQLADGGLMVIPVGERYQQTLYLMRKKNNQLEQEALLPTLFVPMTGKAEESRDKQADPKNPRLVNGDFEFPLPENGHVEGWYYQRGMTLESGSDAPSGDHFVTFRNEVPSQPTSLLQGLAIDGRYVSRIKLSGSVQLENVKQGGVGDELPAITIQFFDENRKRVGLQWIGPFRGTRKWHKVSESFRVPLDTREAIVSIGLFGATGTASFDNVQLESLSK
jgi:protein-L-isoaspartate(D-aspartate) O-methyltransferase